MLDLNVDSCSFSYCLFNCMLVTDMAARRKKDTYLDLARNHFFVPVAIETTGSFSEDTIAFLHELANRITDS